MADSEWLVAGFVMGVVVGLIAGCIVLSVVVCCLLPRLVTPLIHVPATYGEDERRVTRAQVSGESPGVVQPKEEDKPMGYIYATSLVVDRLTILDFVNNTPHAKLLSIEIYNDGPDEVYASVNNYQRGAAIKPGESLRVDMHSPRIEKLFLDVDAGRKAVIRVFGVY